MLVLTLLPVVGSFEHEKVSALTHIDDDYNYYPMGCPLGQYEVSYINDNGDLETISCHDSYYNAQNEMYSKGEEYVVRFGYAYSPTKIVAMVSGNAYAYPGRGNSVTMSIYEYMPNEKSSDASTYVSENYEMQYLETPYMSEKEAWIGTGYAKVNLNGFIGYCDLEFVDLVPSKYIDNGIAIYLGGNNAYNTQEKPYSIKLQYSYYEIVKNGNYNDLAFTYYYAWPDYEGNAKHYTIYIDNASNYPKLASGKKYYSYDGTNFYSDAKCDSNSFVATYFNYYQYLPLRSKTNINASVLDSYLISVKGNNTNSVIKNEGQSFIDAQNKYGVNALIIYAMACNESSYGTSDYAVYRNNLFGWNAVDSEPGKASYYDSVAKCINQQMGKNLRGYLDITDSRYYGAYVGNKGNGFNVKYASDPYWGMKIAAVAYRIDKFSCSNNGSLTDNGSVSYALVNDCNTNVYYNGSYLYNLKGRHETYKHYDTVAVYGYLNSNTNIASVNPIENQTMCTEDAITKYNFENSVVQIDNSKIKMLYGSNPNLYVDTRPEIAHEPMLVINNISISDGKLSIDGYGFVTGYDFLNSTDTTYTLQFYDFANNLIYSQALNTISSDGFDLCDGYIYDYCAFDGVVDLSKYANGSYNMKLNVVNTNTTALLDLRTTTARHSLLIDSTEINNQYHNYKMKTDAMNGYRYVLDIFDSSLNYKQIKLASKYSSILSYDELSIDDNNVLTVSGFGFIYGLDYGTNNNVSYEVYLQNNTNTYMLSTSIDEDNDIGLYIDSNNDLSRIHFTGNIDLSTINKGEYNIIVKMINGDYVDIIELSNTTFKNPITKQVNSNKYTINSTNVKSRLTIKIEGE